MRTPAISSHPETPPAASKWRSRLVVVAGVVGVVAGIAGIVYVVATRPEAQMAPVARASNRTPLGVVPVRGHSKMQPYGPNHSLRKPIDVGPHIRGCNRAA